MLAFAALPCFTHASSLPMASFNSVLPVAAPHAVQLLPLPCLFSSVSGCDAIPRRSRSMYPFSSGSLTVFIYLPRGCMLRSECTRPTPRPGRYDMHETRRPAHETGRPYSPGLPFPLVHAARVIRAWSPYPRPLVPPRLVRPFTRAPIHPGEHSAQPRTAFWPCAFHVASPSTRRLCEARQKRMRQSLAQWPKRRQRWH